jgi:hypothetical protein
MTGFLTFLVLLVAVLMLGAARGRRREREMKTLALQLGLNFERMVLGRPEGAAKTGRGSQKRPGPSPLLKMLPIATSAALTGRVNGVDVRLVPPVSLGDKHTRLYASFRESKNLGLNIASAVALDRVAHSVFGMQDIKSGNDALDRRVVIQAKSAPEATALLRDPNVQHLLLQLYELSILTRVFDEEIRTSVSDIHTDPDKAKSALDLLTRTVIALDSAPAA